MGLALSQGLSLAFQLPARNRRRQQESRQYSHLSSTAIRLPVSDENVTVVEAACSSASASAEAYARFTKSEVQLLFSVWKENFNAFLGKKKVL